MYFCVCGKESGCQFACSTRLSHLPPPRSPSHAIRVARAGPRVRGRQARVGGQSQGAHLIVWVIEAVFELVHCLEYCSERLDKVAENDGLPLEALAFGEALGVDELHLLEDGGFAGLSRSCCRTACQRAAIGRQSMVRGMGGGGRREGAR